MSLGRASPLAVMQVLEFCRRKDHDVLLDVDEDVREAVAVYTVLAFIDHLQSHLVFKKGLAWLPKDFTFDKACVAAVKYTVDRGVVPHQLVQDDGRPLRQLLLRAVRNQECDTIYISCRNATRLWANWLLMLLRVPPTDCCCASVSLGNVEASDRSGPVLRFVHGRYPYDAVLEGPVENPDLEHEATAFAAAYAGHLMCLKYQKASGTFSAVLSRGRQTPLFAAVRGNHAECVRFLTSAVKAPDMAEEPLMFALQNNLMESLEVLAPIPLQRGNARQDVACEAVKLNNFRALKCIVTVDTTPRVSCIVVAKAAIALGREQMLAYLLPIHPSLPNARIPWVDLAVLAVQHGEVPCLQCIMEMGTLSVHQSGTPEGNLFFTAARYSTPCLAFLLKSPNARVDVTNRSGTTVAHHAAGGGLVSCMQLLIAAGADVEACSRDGVSPLLTALRCRRTEMVRHLLQVVKDPFCPAMKDDERASIESMMLSLSSNNRSLSSNHQQSGQ